MFARTGVTVKVKNISKYFNEKILRRGYDYFSGGKVKAIYKSSNIYEALVKWTLRINDNVPAGYYSKGDASEVKMYFTSYSFLICNILDIEYFALENSKKNK